MLNRADRALSLRRQCALLGVARSGVYRARKPRLRHFASGHRSTAAG
jgi:predicted DNA-binding transcriptional regulator AlpA